MEVTIELGDKLYDIIRSLGVSVVAMWVATMIYHFVLTCWKSK